MMIELGSEQKITAINALHNGEYNDIALEPFLPSDHSNGLLFEEQNIFIARIVSGDENIEESISALQNLSDCYLYYAHYLLKHDQYDSYIKAVSQATIYGYHAIKVAHEFRTVFKQPIQIDQIQCLKNWSLIIQCGWWPEMKEIGAIIRAQFAPDSELSKRFITPDDEGMNKQLWFLLSQFNHIIDSPLDNEQLDLPELLYPYDEVVQIWDTQDKDELKKWVYILCEEHLSLTDEGEIFSPITSQLFPYTILAWLAIRKRKGLKNPKRFEHALMQQPLAKLFKDSLPKPDCEGALLLLQKLNNDRNNIAETT